MDRSDGARGGDSVGKMVKSGEKKEIVAPKIRIKRGPLHPSDSGTPATILQQDWRTTISVTHSKQRLMKRSEVMGRSGSAPWAGFRNYITQARITVFLPYGVYSACAVYGGA